MEYAENLSADAAQEAQADSAPGRAMRVAAALQAKGGEEFAKPGSIVEIKFVKGQSLSLTASRLLALMILTAGGDAWQRHHPQSRDRRPTSAPVPDPATPD